MSAIFPTWVNNPEKENLYGQAVAFEATEVVLSSEIATQAFVNIKLSKFLHAQGKIYLIIVPHSKFCIIYLFFCKYQYLVLFNSHRTLYHLFIF